MKYNVSYRGGEVCGGVEAESEEEAIKTFLAGKASNVRVEYWMFHPDMVEAEAEFFDEKSKDER